VGWVIFLLLVIAVLLAVVVWGLFHISEQLMDIAQLLLK
jgi:hypothetical protein